VHPTPVVIVHMSKSEEEPPPYSDLHFAGPKNYDDAAAQIIEELKRKGVLARAIGAKPTFQYSI
jgi:bifunctional enzyme CysN/CysC